MKVFAIVLASAGWLLGLVSLYLAWGLRLDGLKLFVPLFGFTLALLICGFTALVCLWQLFRLSKTREEVVVYVVVGCLALAPWAWIGSEYRSYMGPRDQFLLKLMLNPRL